MLEADTQTSRKLRGLPPYILAIAVSGVLGLAVARLPFRDVGTLSLVVAAALVAIAASAGHQRVLVVIGAFVYVGIIQWTYVDWIVPIFAYSGLIETGVEWPSIVVVTVLAVVPAAWLPGRLERPSDVILWFLYLFGYVPACVIPIHILGPALWVVLPLEVALVIAFGTLGLMHRVPVAPVHWAGISERLFVRILVILGVVSIPYLIVVFWPISPPDLASVYETRAVYQNVLNASLAAGYFVTWLGNIVYPLLMALGMAQSRRLILVLGIVGQFLIYAVSGLKEMLFSIVFVPLMYLALRHGARRFGLFLMWGGVSVVAISVAAAAAGSILALALFVVRSIVIPGQLTAYYFDFFSSHPTYMLSHSFLRLFVARPYDIDPPYLVGRVYLHTTVDANANIWADAMANFGLLGIIPFTVVLGVVLWIFDSVASGRDIRVVGSILGLAGLALANGGLFTSLLTAGIGLTVGVIALMPKGPIRRTIPAVARGP